MWSSTVSFYNFILIVILAFKTQFSLLFCSNLADNWCFVSGISYVIIDELAYLCTVLCMLISVFLPRPYLDILCYIEYII